MKPGAHRPFAFTPDQLYERAVYRRDLKRGIAKMLAVAGRLADANFVLDNRAPHANRGTPPRKHFDRRKQRADAKAIYDRQIRKEAEIGTDPLYANNHPNRHGASALWRKMSKEWDRANQGVRP